MRYRYTVRLLCGDEVRFESADEPMAIMAMVGSKGEWFLVPSEEGRVEIISKVQVQYISAEAIGDD